MVADALSRKSIHHLCSTLSRVSLRDEIEKMGVHVIKKGENIGDLTIEPELYSEIREKQQYGSRIAKWWALAANGETTWLGLDTDASLYFEGCWCVPDDEELQRSILSEAHNTPYSVHPGGDKLYKGLKKTFWWPGMKREVA
ncbi:uncharacterized protein LOC141628734 [Silene latifolia]|uniref:uncharacterized protein LOC141628734 n=1 Tax=Silene latifolia TaxID=37657 RepID=UPI003D77B265